MPDFTLLVSARERTGTQVVQVEVLVPRATWLCTYINLFNPYSHLTERGCPVFQVIGEVM